MAHMQGRAGVPPFYAGMHLAGYGAQQKAATEVAALAEKLYAIDIDGGEAAAVDMAVDGEEVTRSVIKVKTLTGRVIDVDVEPMDAVGRIKERVQEKEGIPPEQQRLIFGGKQLADGETVRESNLMAGAVIHLVLALRGGGRYNR